MATIYDVARKAGVSTYTVSSVVNRSAYVSPELTKRVLKAVRELDYTPNALARGLQTRSSRTVGMLIPDIGSPFYARVVRGVEDRLRQAGYSLLLGNTYNDPDEQSRYLAVFRSQQADGFLLFLAAGDESEAERMVRAKKPVVFVGRTPRSFEADSVTIDNVKGTRLAVEHLIAAGHRRIAIVTGQLTLSTSADRVEGWRRTLRRHKLTAPAEYVCEGDWTANSGHALTSRLLDLSGPPTAIFAANFLMMTGVLRALKERGLRCPQDVQVLSSDDSEWLDVFSPPITTVVQPSYSMGERAADLLLKRMQQLGRKFETVLLDPELHVRT
ncbi:MAG TPA: LacI family DNA-binding transcriptional regulator [Bryobacteraceae bacterium]|nr:LacI family DNA-binding transcriptional regulator [Bryobacteraceae bacterium]